MNRSDKREIAAGVLMLAGFAALGLVLFGFVATGKLSVFPLLVGLLCMVAWRSLHKRGRR